MGSKNKSLSLSEHDFVEQQLSEGCTSSNVCICDTPGMGKSFLLASIARYMAAKSTDRIIVYIPMSKLCMLLSQVSVFSSPNSETILNAVFKHASEENQSLLLELVKAKLLRVEVFIDGYDEIYSVDVEWIKNAFQSTITGFPKIRFFFTSKHHLREELERMLHTISFTILPFDYQTQVDFLVEFWSTSKQNCDVESLRKNAIRCLKTINQSFSSCDKELTENPSLCKATAETFAEEVTARKIYKFPINICEILKIFIEERIKKFGEHDDKIIEKIDYILLAHTFHALKTIFPDHEFHDDEIFKAVHHYTMSFDILRIGIVQQSTNDFNVPFDFIHVSLAEHFVAKYFSKRLHNERIFEFFVECVLHTSNKEHNFPYKSIASFCDYSIVNISEEIKSQAIKFCNSRLPHKIFTLLCACCQQNLRNTFCLLKEALTYCDNSKIREYFTPEKCYELLSDCIRWTTCQMFHSCVQLFMEVLQLEVANIPICSDNQETLLQLAVKFVNYEAVEYLGARVSLRRQNILEICVANSCNDPDIQSKEVILQLLLIKDPGLIDENLTFLSHAHIHPRFKNLLKEKGVKLTERANGDEVVSSTNKNSPEKKLGTGSSRSIVSTNDIKEVVNLDAKIAGHSITTTEERHQDKQTLKYSKDNYLLRNEKQTKRRHVFCAFGCCKTLLAIREVLSVESTSKSANTVSYQHRLSSSKQSSSRSRSRYRSSSETKKSKGLQQSKSPQKRTRSRSKSNLRSRRQRHLSNPSSRALEQSYSRGSSPKSKYMSRRSMSSSGSKRKRRRLRSISRESSHINRSSTSRQEKTGVKISSPSSFKSSRRKGKDS